MKEAETLQDMVALIRADDLGPRQCYEIVKHVTKLEGDIPEIAQVREELTMNQSNSSLPPGKNEASVRCEYETMQESRVSGQCRKAVQCFKKPIV